MTGAYDPQLLVLSVLLAVAAAFTALNLAQRVAVSRGVAARTWLVTGASAVGVGLWSAQFFWMLAFHLPVPVVHHLPTMLFSLSFAVLVSFFALWIASGPRIGGWRLAVAGLCMGLGLTGVHYTGVFAMQIIPAILFDGRSFAISVAIAITTSWLALWLAFVLRPACTLPMLLARAAAGLLLGAGFCGVFLTGMSTARFAPDSYSLGAAMGQSPVMTDRLLIIIATAAAIALLVVMVLTIIDHAHAQAAAHRRTGVAGLVDREQLEKSFSTLHEAGGTDQMIAVMMVEIEEYKVAGTAIGPQGREQVLREVGQRLVALVRPGDSVGGLAEGRFALLLTGLRDLAQVPRIAARVREEIGRGIPLGERDVRVTSRTGASTFPADGGDLDTLLRLAAAALSRD
jgi:NO-binding membrane sensor protein with MHYT domain